jgi:hypothetical protein
VGITNLLAPSQVRFEQLFCFKFFDGKKKVRKKNSLEIYDNNANISYSRCHLIPIHKSSLFSTFPK